jgi:hypothetical protein
MRPAPIKIAADAEEHLRTALAGTFHHQDAAIVWSPRIKDGEKTPAVIFGWYAKGKRPEDSFFDLFGYPVSIMPTTLEHIEGKTISRVRHETGFSHGPKHIYVLEVG